MRGLHHAPARSGGDGRSLFGYGRIFDRELVAILRAQPGRWVLARTYWNTKNIEVARGGLLRPADIQVVVRATTDRGRRGDVAWQAWGGPGRRPVPRVEVWGMAP